MPLPTVIRSLADMMDHCRNKLDDYFDFDEHGTSHEDENLLWKNPELVLAANAAIYEVALRSRCIRDNSQLVGHTLFPVATSDSGWVTIGDFWLSLHRVSWIDAATGEVTPLVRHFEGRLDNEVNEWDTKTGDPWAFVINISSRDVRVFPRPEADGSLRIEGTRLPTDDELMTDNDDEPVIAQHYLMEAISWMCHLAYQKNDADTKDPQQEARFEAMFEQRFGPRPDAKSIELQVKQVQKHRPRIYDR